MANLSRRAYGKRRFSPGERQQDSQQRLGPTPLRSSALLLELGPSCEVARSELVSSVETVADSSGRVGPPSGTVVVTDELRLRQGQ